MQSNFRQRQVGPVSLAMQTPENKGLGILQLGRDRQRKSPTSCIILITHQSATIFFEMKYSIFMPLELQYNKTKLKEQNHENERECAVTQILSLSMKVSENGLF